jgi:hypothetical protein
MKTAIDSVILLLEREAGYHLILVIDAQARGAVGHDLVIFGLGVLSRSMAGKIPLPPGTITDTQTQRREQTPPDPEKVIPA